MIVPQAIFRNNDETAHAVLDYLDEFLSLPHRFTLRPYDFHRPEFSEWWFIPSTEWPAYHHSKLFVHQSPIRPAAPEWLYTGFYVEQGFGQELAGFPDVQRKYIMRADWYWHEFLLHARNGEIDPTLRQVLERSQCPLWVWIDVYEFNRVQELDTDRYRRGPDDWVEFTIYAQDTKFILAQPGRKVLAQLNTCANIRELAQLLETLEDLRFFWVNLQVGVRLRYGTESEGFWNALEIWGNALEPWIPSIG